MYLLLKLLIFYYVLVKKVTKRNNHINTKLIIKIINVKMLLFSFSIFLYFSLTVD